MADGFELFTDRSVVAMRVNGELKDLATQVTTTDTVEPVTIDSPDGLSILRHSTAHVLAQAVQSINPEAKLGIGPPITDGFYYDFDVLESFTPEDLKVLDKEMSRIVRAGQRFRAPRGDRRGGTRRAGDEPYKLELIGLKGGVVHGDTAAFDESESVEVGGGELTIYDNVDPKTGETVWRDLCRGPHLPNTRMIGNGWALTRVAAAYWRGNEKNKQLQRIYGTAWPTKDELRAYQVRMEEAAKRDHRKLGAELDLFSFPDEIGSGLAVFHPKGGIIRNEIENYMRERLIANDYELVNTPHITKGRLYEISQHLNWYREGMFPPMHLDEEIDAEGNVTRQGQDYYLKPMNCPMHNLIYRASGRSYRELPLRLAEFGTVYRYEKSGTLSGLTRVRGLTQDDAHIYVTEDQIKDEVARQLEFVLETLRGYGLDNFYLELSTKDPDKYVGSDESWEQATETLRQVAVESGLELVADPGGAAFYGPKISVQARDAIGRTWQLVDRAARLQPARAVRTRIHRGGRHAQAAGDDPPRAPRLDRAVLRHPARALRRRVPGVAVPGAGRRHPGRGCVRHLPRRRDLAPQGSRRPCRGRPLRRPDAEEDPHAHQGQGPVQLIVGEEDAAAGTVSFRFRDGTQRNGVTVDEAIDRIVGAIEKHEQVDTAWLD